MLSGIRRRGRIVAALGGFLWPALLQAQAPVAVKPEDGGYLQWAVAGGIGVMVVVSAFLNPKRSHLN